MFLLQIKWQWGGVREILLASVSCVVVMLSSSTESLSSISLFVYCASPTPPMMSHSQLLISNQCRCVLYPLCPSFLSHPGRAGLLTGSHKWMNEWMNEYPNTVLFQLMTKQEKKRKASSSGPSLCVGHNSCSLSPQDMPVVCGMPKQDSFPKLTSLYRSL